jgi:hypothetical protein
LLCELRPVLLSSSPHLSVFTLSLLTLTLPADDYAPKWHGFHISPLAKTLEVQGTPLNLSPKQLWH